MATKKINTTKQNCSESDCDKTVYSNSICNMHYKRRLRQNAKLSSREEIAKMFWLYVRKGENDNDCWSWACSRDGKGYGQFELKYKMYKAHRTSFYLHFGYWPKNCVLHSCDNPPCANPLHLREGTNQENMDDKVKRGRQARALAKLTPEDVRNIKIRLANGEMQKHIARDYPFVHPVAISLIHTGKQWRDIKI